MWEGRECSSLTLYHPLCACDPRRIPSNLHAKLKTVQVKILRAMAGLEEADLMMLSDMEGEGEEEEVAITRAKKGREREAPHDRLTCLPQDALLQVPIHVI